MKETLMRFLDYWVGVPVCFFLSSLRFLSLPLQILFSKRKSEKNKILFIKLSEMGSIVLALPLIKKVKDSFYSGEVYFLTFSKNVELLNILNPYIQINNIFSINDSSLLKFIFDLIKCIKEIRKRKIDIVIDLEFFSRCTAIISFFTGAQRKVGFYRYCLEGLFRGNLFTHKIFYNPLIHISKIYLSFFESISLDKKTTLAVIDDYNKKSIFLPQIILNQTAVEKLRVKLENYSLSKENKLFLIHPGEGNLSVRDWPIYNFVEISKHLLKENPQRAILIVGTKSCHQKAEQICTALPGKKCYNFTGKTNLSELIALFDISKLLLTSDSGIAHLASLTQVNNFVIFGPESPQIFSPLGEKTQIIYSQLICSPCLSVFNHRRTLCKDNRCMRNITPDFVLGTIKDKI